MTPPEIRVNVTEAALNEFKAAISGIDGVTVLSGLKTEDGTFDPLITKVNKIVGKMEDDVSIEDLWYLDDSRFKSPAVWVEFRNGLPILENRRLKSTLRALLRSGWSQDIKTVGDVRGATEDRLVLILGIGIKRAKFLKEAFKRSGPEVDPE